MAKNIDSYLSLVTAEHSDKPNFAATIGVSVDPSVDAQALYDSIPGLYDIDVAVGQQLDVVGEWVGVKRTLAAPLTGVYFAFDTANVGFDSGVWQGPYDPSTGLISLPDEFYRLVIRARILNNHWDGSKSQLYALAQTIFGPSGFTYYVEDHADLTISIGLLGPTNPPPILTALLNSGALDVKPVTIQIVKRIAQQGPVFALNVDTSLFKGFDAGYWAIST